MPRALSRKSSLARLLDATKTPVYVLDDRRRIVYCNQALAMKMKTRADDLVGLRCAYHSEVRAINVEPAAVDVNCLCPSPLVFSGQPQQSRIDFDHSDAETVRFVPLMDDEDHVIGVLASVERPGERETGLREESAEADQLHGQIKRLRAELGKGFQVEQLLGTSAASLQIRQQVRLAAANNANMLIVGPAGSGREHVARTIHYAANSENPAALVPLSCALLDAELLHTTITAFIQRSPELETEQVAAILLLDIDQLLAEAQTELLGLLSDDDLGLRTLATSTRGLTELSQRGEFLVELAYRLSTLTITLPPVIDRLADIPLWVQYFVEQFNVQHEKQLAGVSTEAMEQLLAYPWPGNLDEMREVVHQACGGAAEAQLEAKDLPRRIRLSIDASLHPVDEPRTIELDTFLEQVERELLERALCRADGNKAQAARLLGISRPRLLRRMAHLKLRAS